MIGLSSSGPDMAGTRRYEDSNKQRSNAEKMIRNLELTLLNRQLNRRNLSCRSRIESRMTDPASSVRPGFRLFASLRPE
jgi:hypothetical protein